MIVQPRIPNAETPLGASHTAGSLSMNSSLYTFWSTVEIAQIRYDFPVPAVSSTLEGFECDWEIVMHVWLYEYEHVSQDFLE